MSLKAKRNLPLIALFAGVVTLLIFALGSYPIVAY